MTMLPRSTSARRPGGETGASIVEYAIIVVGVCAALVAVAWGLRSVMASSFTTAQTTIGQDRAALVLNHVGAIAPTHLTATAGDASIILTWDDMPASTSYTVTNCGTTSAPSLSGSTWTVLCTGLTNGTPYVVAVTATGPGGTSSPSTATATPQPPAPATPTAVTAVAGDRLITVTWNAMPNATSYTVTGCGSAVAYPTDRTQTGATCTGLTNGTTYSVSVTATNNGGSSSPSSPVTAVPHPPAPGAPTTLTATAGPASPTTITLQWAASTGATGYKVYGCTTPQPIVLATPVTTYTCTGLVTGTSYTVYVTATNLGGESAASPTATATPVAAPAAPTNLTATPGNRTIALTWGAMPGAASYSITGCGASITPSANPTGTAATCTLLTNGTNYTVSVTATGPGGTSPASTVTVTTPFQVPRGSTDSTQRMGSSGSPGVTNCSVASVVPTVAGVTVTCTNSSRRVNFTVSASAPANTVVAVTVTFTQGGSQTQTFWYLIT